VPPTAAEPAHAYFHGRISTELPRDRPEVVRTGYAAWRTHDRPPTLFGRSLWDIDPYTYLAMRVKSDGRKYFVNLQTETIVPTDIHQHRLYAKRPGEWETVLIPWHDFVRTNHGFVVEPQSEMMRQKLRSVGIGLTDRIPGEYHLRIQRLWATNGLTEQDLIEDGRSLESPSEKKKASPASSEKPALSS
jgi:NADH dehydrogenase [ubiquinone] 1 alpha subcomplex assembly factor 1